MKTWEEHIWGIVENSSSEWVLLQRIINDYMFDGYTLIRQKYVKKVIRNENVIFKEKVLNAKRNSDILISKNIPINTVFSPLQWMMDNKEVFMISPKDESISYVGQITRILKESFYLKAINSRGIWDEKLFLYKINNIRAIDFDNDYINSLLTYVGKNKSI